MNRLRKFIPHISSVFIYLVVSVIYMMRLNEYNMELIGKNYIEILLYQNGQSWYYFLVAIALIVSGCLISYLSIKTRYILNDAIDLFILIVIILIIVAVCILLIYFIQNPILRAIFALIMGGTAYICSQS